MTTIAYHTKTGARVATCYHSAEGPVAQLNVTLTEVPSWAGVRLYVDPGTIKGGEKLVGTLEDLLKAYASHTILYDTAVRRNQIARDLEASEHYNDNPKIRDAATRLREGAHQAMRDGLRIVQ